MDRTQKARLLVGIGAVLGLVGILVLFVGGNGSIECEGESLDAAFRCLVSTVLVLVVLLVTAAALVAAGVIMLATAGAVAAGAGSGGPEDTSSEDD